ncbi:MAG: DUF479 domain-containing protein [Nevskiaceae bacterium]|nr:MAG: DUF479 domain-containing protein [Nevskiaceae bacterium]TBR74301.1 MAG: DUF479 domain-containing protein [Nevskiaceae bacterium]
MNFLAHLWLADVTRTSPAGAILGDIVHGRLEALALPTDIALGIRIHRRVDATTDHHPLSVAWRAHFPPELRRYAGITLDLLCDHVLARDWPRYATAPLAGFAATAAAAVAAEDTTFSRFGTWRPETERFAALLCSYTEWPGFERALAHTATRLKNPQPLLATAPVAATLLPEICNGLPILMHDLKAAATVVRETKGSGSGIGD